MRQHLRDCVCFVKKIVSGIYAVPLVPLYYTTITTCVVGMLCVFVLVALILFGCTPRW